MLTPKIVLAAVLLLSGIALCMPPAEAALSPSCQDYRQSIIDMERSVSSGAALQVDLRLRQLYVRNCLQHPEGGNDPGTARTDPWFNAEGAPASGPPPAGDGLYQTTPQIAEYCRDTSNPQLCALMLDIGEGEMLVEGGDPNDPGYWSKPQRQIDPADELPPVRIDVAGQHYSISDGCLSWLAGLLAKSWTSNGQNDQLRRALSGPHCAAEVDAIRPHIGALQAEIRKWRTAAVVDPTAPIGKRGSPLQPGYHEMCRQAFENQNTCKARLAGISSVGTNASAGGTGQAGAYADCANLYGSVVQMCQQSGWISPAVNAPWANGLSPACRALIQSYVAAAQAHDGPAALDGYHALQQAGGCGVLPQAEPAATPASADPRFVPRGDTPMLDATAVPCDQNPEACAAAVDQLRAGTSPAAVATLYENAIGIGLQLGGAMAQGVARASTPSLRGAPQSNMNSLAPGRVRSTYGQGSRSAPRPPAPNTGCVDCRVGTAQ